MSSIEELSNKVNLNQDVNIEKEVNNGVNEEDVNIEKEVNNGVNEEDVNIEKEVNNGVNEEDVNKVDKIKNINNKVNNINNNINKKIVNKNKNKIELVNKKIEEINKNTNSNIPIIKNIHVDESNLLKPRGILDPEGKEPNPLTGKEYKNLYTEVEKGNTYAGFAEKAWVPLPVYQQREEFIKTIYESQCILITAGTGSGKTVLIPKFVLHALNYQGNIIVTIPRKTATKGAADFAAKTLDVPLGDKVGYMVKDDTKVGPNTKLTYMTDGYVLNWLNGSNRLLEGYDALIIDEAHERNINIDQILFLAKNILSQRPDFKFIIMSATIDPTMFKKYYAKFNIKHLEADPAPNFSVKPVYLPPGQEVNKLAPNGEVINKDYLKKSVEIMFDNIIKPGLPGDILALYPSVSDLKEACLELQRMMKNEKMKNSSFEKSAFCIELHSKSSSRPYGEGTEENYAVGNKSYKVLPEYSKFTDENQEKGNIRRVVMATEVAESAITLKGDIVDWVIDTGLSNNVTYYPETELEALEKKYISEANHTQRVGRTGRQRKGTCFNVFTEAEYKKFLKYPIPPIMTSDVTDTVLTFLMNPLIKHIDLPFSYVKAKNSIEPVEESLNSFLSKMIEPPDIKYINNAIKKLFLLGAIEISDRKAILTPFGKAIGSFRDIGPQKAACVIESYNYNCSTEVIELMSLLTLLEDDFSKILNIPSIKIKDKNSKEYKEEEQKQQKVLKALSTTYGDHITLYKILKTYKEKNFNVRWERGRQVLEQKENSEGAKWAKENFVNAKKLKDAIRNGKEIGRFLGRVIGDYRRDNPDKIDKKIIFRNIVPKLHEKIEDNIMQAISKGYIGHIVKKAGKDYRTCFPEVQSIAQLDKDSLFRFVTVKPMTCIYGKFMSIFGRKKFQTFTKIPVKVISNLNDDNEEIISKCSKSVKNVKEKRSKSKKFTKRR
jgi:HrpA-like RNA helicase